MPSDLERLLLGLVSAAEGYQSRRQSDRELMLRMSDRDLAKRKDLRDERRARLEEFSTLGDSMDTIERGSRIRPPQEVNGITIGQDLTQRDTADLAAAETSGREAAS